MKMRLKKDNRGVSLVFVLGVIAIVTVVVTIALAMGLSNYLMKVTNRGSKENFYDAEQVLDEICLGLQQDISEAMSAAYVETYNDYLDRDALESEKYFASAYTDRLRDKLESKKHKGFYDMDHLLGFLDENVKKNTTLSTSKGRNPVLNLNSNGVVLKNLYLTYINEQDYSSRIATDIHLKIPDMNFAYSDSSARLLQYSIVAGKGVSVASKTKALSLEGNVYAGAADNSKNSVYLSGSDIVVNLREGRTLVAKEAINLWRGTFNQEKGADIWANDISVNSYAELNLNGTTYVANDLEFLEGGTVNIAGKYYGFGNPQTALQAKSIKDAGLETDIKEHPADYSSAILVNGFYSNKTNVELNLESADALMLAGNAYLDDSRLMLGESLSVKVNQLAYMVPDSCMMGEPNPITPDRRNALLGITETDTEDEKRNKENAFEQRLLLNVRANVSADVEKIVRLVDRKNYYYYYMEFPDAKTASKYFSERYQRGTFDKVRDDLQLYVKKEKVKINRDMDMTANGNILVYDENGISVIGDTIEEGSKDISENRKVTEQMINCQNIFKALNTNLTRDYDSLTGTQKARKGVYYNIFDGGLFRHILATIYLPHQDGEKIYVGYCSSGGDTVSTIKANAKKRYGENAEVSLIIASGDVTIDEDYNGLIICGGKAVISAKSVENPRICLGTNPAGTMAVLEEKFQPMANGGIVQSARKDEVYTLMDYLYDSDIYLGKSFAVDKRSDNAVRLEELVEYVNWSRE